MNDTELAAGMSCLVKCFDQQIDKNYRHKLISMGIMPGATFQIAGIAPLGDTLHIVINGFSLALRRKELRYVTLEATH